MSSNQQNAKIFKIILAGELRKATAAIRFRTVMQQHFGDEFVVGQPVDEAIAEEEQHHRDNLIFLYFNLVFYFFSLIIF